MGLMEKPAALRNVRNLGVGNAVPGVPSGAMP